jgi:hypothetical protein
MFRGGLRCCIPFEEIDGLEAKEKSEWGISRK